MFDQFFCHFQFNALTDVAGTFCCTISIEVNKMIRRGKNISFRQRNKYTLPEFYFSANRFQTPLG
jgi:hypothetical protein